eukprot:PhM_4_TR9159/c0_g1_i1/m.38641/K04710/CERS; ceramide synthetase
MTKTNNYIPEYPFEPTFNPTLITGCVISMMGLAHSFISLPKLDVPSWNTHTLPFLFAWCFFTLVRQILYDIMIPWLLARGATPGSPPTTPTSETEMDIHSKAEVKARKFVQQFLNLLFHTCSTLWILQMQVKGAWEPSLNYFNDYDRIWVNFDIQTQHRDLVILYLMQLGYHANTLIVHHREPRREDHTVMTAHHTVTVFLLFCSFATNCLRSGSMVLLFHDSSDIFICFSKMANYMNHMPSIVFGFPVAILGWFYMRLVRFPYYIKFSWESRHLYPEHLDVWPYKTSVVGLGVLAVMHAYWLTLMLMMAKSVIVSRGKERVDITETKGSRKKI